MIMISYNAQWVADLLLAGGELGDVGVVALLHVLVCALQDGILLQRGHLLHLLHAAQPRVGVRLAPAEVHPARVDLFASPGSLGGRAATSDLPGENPGPSVQ